MGKNRLTARNKEPAGEAGASRKGPSANLAGILEIHRTCNCRISIWRDSTQLPSFKTLNRAGMKTVIFPLVVLHLIGGELFSKL
jgi:hypothetical protein